MRGDEEYSVRRVGAHVRLLQGPVSRLLETGPHYEKPRLLHFLEGVIILAFRHQIGNHRVPSKRTLPN